VKPKRFSSIVNSLKVDRYVLAFYPSRMAGRYQTSFLSRMVNGKRVFYKAADGRLAMVDWEGQRAWILANRL
jgi:hypothetical protein